MENEGFAESTEYVRLHLRRHLRRTQHILRRSVRIYDLDTSLRPDTGGRVKLAVALYRVSLSLSLCVCVSICVIYACVCVQVSELCRVHCVRV